MACIHMHTYAFSLRQVMLGIAGKLVAKHTVVKGSLQLLATYLTAPPLSLGAHLACTEQQSVNPVCPVSTALTPNTNHAQGCREPGTLVAGCTG